MDYAVTPSPCCSWSLWEHRFTQPTSSAASRLLTQKKRQGSNFRQKSGGKF